MKTFNVFYFRFFVVLCMIPALSFSFAGAYFSDFKPLDVSVSAASAFFSNSRLPEEILKQMMSGNAGAKDAAGNKKENKKPDKSISAVLIPVLDCYSGSNIINHQFLNAANIPGFVFSFDVDYPLKILFNRCFIFILMLLGLLSGALPRSVPLAFISIYKKLILFSQRISFFYLGRIYYEI